MPAFILLVFLGGILVWLLMSSAFVPLGRVAKQIWEDAKEAMNTQDENENENTEERKD